MFKVAPSFSMDVKSRRAHRDEDTKRLLVEKHTSSRRRHGEKERPMHFLTQLY